MQRSDAPNPAGSGGSQTLARVRAAREIAERRAAEAHRAREAAAQEKRSRGTDDGLCSAGRPWAGAGFLEDDRAMGDSDSDDEAFNDEDALTLASRLTVMPELSLVRRSSTRLL